MNNDCGVFFCYQSEWSQGKNCYTETCVETILERLRKDFRLEYDNSIVRKEASFILPKTLLSHFSLKYHFPRRSRRAPVRLLENLHKTKFL